MDNLVKWISGIVVGVVALFIVIAFFSSFTVIEPGYVGVIFNQMTGDLKAVPQGLAFKIPFITTVQEYPIALRTYTMVQKANEGSSATQDDIDLPTREGQHIKQDISVTYNTTGDKASEVFKSFKGADISEIETTFIRRLIITAAQNTAGQMSLTELISSQRNKLQSAIEVTLKIEMTKMGFTLDKVNLGASHLPEAIEKQMQEKMAAQQKAQQSQYVLEQNQVMAKAAVAQATGEANAILVKAQAQAKANKLLQETLTPLLIENKKIEKWSGDVPYISGGGTPIIDLRNKKDAEAESK